MFELGIKSDPIEYRYSFDWLFSLMNELGIKNVQIGSFFELYMVEDDYLHDLFECARKYGIRIKSCFTAHRELGGFFTGVPALEKVARKAYERLIHVASLLGADYAGSNPGAVYRDLPQRKEPGIACYLSHMKELQEIAGGSGLKGLCIEPMSCAAEPPSFPHEIDYMLKELNGYHDRHASSAVPVYLCSDISHGIADYKKTIIHNNYDLFRHSIPWMAEFHIKNTDALFQSTFSFATEEERQAGIVKLEALSSMICENRHRFPVNEIVGYLEISGPKLGRDYSDRELEAQLRSSVSYMQKTLRSLENER